MNIKSSRFQEACQKVSKFISFPNFSIGNLYAVDDIVLLWKNSCRRYQYSSLSIEGLPPFAQAQSKVEIPENKQIVLAANSSNITLLTDLQDGDLQGLSLSFTGVSDRHLSLISSCPSLKALDVFGAKRINFSSIAQMTELEIVSVKSKQITNLFEINSPKLTTLRLISTELTVIDAMVIAGLPNLSELFLTNVILSTEVLDVIGKSPYLSSLTITESGLKNESLKHLSKMPKLTKLELSMNDIDDKGLKTLTQLPLLEWLNLDGTFCTEKSQVWFTEAMPNCKVVGIQRKQNK